MKTVNYLIKCVSPSLLIDVLERNLINYAIEKDLKENINRAPSCRKNEHMQNVIDAVNNCGVSFSVWQKKDANGGNSGIYDWTSMVGDEKKTVLRKLPDVFPQIIAPPHCEPLIHFITFSF